jgi:hypothetical protein
MRLTFKLILGSVIALTLGLGAASPILIPNLALTTKVQIEVDVVYAYFGVQEFTSNITGLWRNCSSLWENDLHIISYLFVLNVTNPTDKLLMLGEFTASAAPQIQVTQHPKGELSIAQTDTIASAFRDLSRYYPGWSQYWQPNTTRLIALSGTIENSNIAAYDALQTGTIYLFGRVEGKICGGGWANGYSLKHIQLQKIGNEYLYNTLLNENQILRLSQDGIDVFIETRR